MKKRRQKPQFQANMFFSRRRLGCQTFEPSLKLCGFGLFDIISLASTTSGNYLVRSFWCHFSLTTNHNSIKMITRESKPLVFELMLRPLEYMLHCSKYWIATSKEISDWLYWQRRDEINQASFFSLFTAFLKLTFTSEKKTVNS